MKREYRYDSEAALHFLIESPGEPPREVAAAVVGVRDGRKIRPSLDALARAGLARESMTSRLWWPTARGKEVDAILDRITVARGGSFKPMSQAGLTTSEVLALRAGGGRHS